LKHVDGTISMARDGPDTATGSFSIVIGNQPEMDFGGRRNPDGGIRVRYVARDGCRQGDPGIADQAGPYGTELLSPPIKILKAYRRTPSG
jgi:peptidyl-prolyl cis-trans isomerase A (cyclophilin A)